MLTRIAIVLLSSLSLIPQKQSKDLIRFDHIGESDKPIINLLISTEEKWTTGDTDHYIMVSKSLLYKIKKYVVDNKAKGVHKGNNAFGCFRITSQINGDRVEYFLPDRLVALGYFGNLKIELEEKEKDNYVSKELAALIKRISIKR